jgi:hypothetical protein
MIQDELPVELDQIINQRRCPYKNGCKSSSGNGLCFGDFELCPEYQNRYDIDVAIYSLHGGLVRFNGELK